MPCGILPFFRNGNEKVWGCIETNRVGQLIVTTPPTGTQDLIAIQKKPPGQRLVLQAGKSIDADCDCLNTFKGQSLNTGVLQRVVDVSNDNGYEVFLENPLATAEHETFEEHGVDLRKKDGEHNELVVGSHNFGPMDVIAKRGLIKQQVYVAELSPQVAGIKLSCTDDKKEEKIAAFVNNIFYEKGVWGTLADFRAKLEQAKLDLSAAPSKGCFKPNQLAEMGKEVVAFENRLNLIERIESNLDDLAKNEGRARFPVDYT